MLRLVALLLDQVKVALCPEVVVVGEAWKLTEGALPDPPPEEPPPPLFEAEELPHAESSESVDNAKQHRRADAIRRLGPMAEKAAKLLSRI